MPALFITLYAVVAFLVNWFAFSAAVVYSEKHGRLSTYATAPYSLMDIKSDIGGAILVVGAVMQFWIIGIPIAFLCIMHDAGTLPKFRSPMRRLTKELINPKENV